MNRAVPLTHALKPLHDASLRATWLCFGETADDFCELDYRLRYLLQWTDLMSQL